MAYYLVQARPVPSLLGELQARLAAEAFRPLLPYGPTLQHGLSNARRGGEGYALWEEEDYCSPPLRQEREAVLDRYFTDLSVERVRPGEGWERVRNLDHLFPSLADI
jgi:hypothetical protein